MVVLAQPLLVDHGLALARAAASLGMPAISGLEVRARSGLMLTYSWRLEDDLRLVPGYVDRILRGEAPGSLPVQRPTRYHLSVNVPAARAVGITIPRSLLVRADEVIE